jgi:hypothetical protein
MLCASSDKIISQTRTLARTVNHWSILSYHWHCTRDVFMLSDELYLIPPEHNCRSTISLALFSDTNYTAIVTCRLDLNHADGKLLPWSL